MANQRGMLTSLITIGAAGAAIYGITKGVQNGTFKRLPETLSNVMNNPQVQQMTNSLQNMTGNQNDQQGSSHMQEAAVSQNVEHHLGNNTSNELY